MRILAWNIQFFTLKRIYNDTGTDGIDHLLNAAGSLANSNYITSTVTGQDASIFVVVEPRSSQGTIGTLATSGGPDGLLYLLVLLRKSNSNWALVPPLRTVNKDVLSTTYTESVGVFYRADRLTFTGPYVWPNAKKNTGPSVPPGATASTYPDPWDKMVPTGTTAAAQCQFYNNLNQEVTFPGSQDRRPVLTTFTEKNSPNRKFKIFAVHTTPGANAQTATARMLGLAEAVPADDEISVFAGDFNVDAIENKNAFFTSIPMLYDFDYTVPAEPTIYRPTTGQQQYQATPSNYRPQKSLDNFWVRYGQNVTPQQTPTGYVINRVVDGTGIPNGLSKDMIYSLQQIQQLQSTEQQNEVFRSLLNYGHLAAPNANLRGGTSDHLPIIVDI